MFCEEYITPVEEFKNKLAELENQKMGGIFELDTGRFKGIKPLSDALTVNGMTKLYPFEVAKRRIYAGTQFEHENIKDVALIQIDIPQNPRQCVLLVYSLSPAFRDVIARNLLDLLAKIK